MSDGVDSFPAGVSAADRTSGSERWKELEVILPAGDLLTIRRAHLANGGLDVELAGSDRVTAVIVPHSDVRGRIITDDADGIHVDFRAGVLHFLPLGGVAGLRFEEGFDFVSVNVPSGLLRRPKRTLKHILSDTPAPTGKPDPVVLGLLEALGGAIANPAEAAPTFCSLVCSALLAHVNHSYFEEHSASARRQGLTKHQAGIAKRMMTERYDQTIPLAAVAQACGVSSSHFIRAFRQSIGLPPHRWLTMQRIEKAIEEMRTSRSSLADIAYRFGFVDQSHFSRVFLSKMGTSPGRWRRQFGLGTEDDAGNTLKLGSVRAGAEGGPDR